VISKTVGATGDYADWGTALTWLDTQFPLGEDHTITQIGNVSDAAGGSIAADADFGTYTVTLTSDTPHNSVPGEGWEILVGTTSRIIDFGVGTGVRNGVLEIKNLRFVTAAAYDQIIGLAAKDGMTIKFHDVMFSGSTVHQGAASGAIQIEAWDATSVVEVWNNINDPYGTSAAASYAWVFSNNNANASFRVENCTSRVQNASVTDSRTYHVSADTGPIIFKSNWATYQSATGQGYSGSLTNCEGYGNASSDATANAFGTTGTYYNSLSSMYITADFSTYPWNYWSPFKRELVYDSGVSPSIASNTTDMYGEPRPSAGRTAIGALNDGRSRSFTVGLVGGDYLNWGAAINPVYAIGIGGDYTYTQISDTTDTASAIFNDELNGYTLILTSNSPHGGDRNIGWVSNFAVDAEGLRIAFVGASAKYGGEAYVSELNIRRLVYTYGNLLDLRPSALASSIAAWNIIMDWSFTSIALTVLTNGCDIAPTGAYSSIICYNIISLWYKTNSTSRYALSGKSALLSLSDTAIENCSVVFDPTSTSGVAFQSAVSATTGAIYRNCVAINNAYKSVALMDTSIGTGNAADDAWVGDTYWAYGEGNITNIVPTDEYQSVNPDDGSLFLSPKTSSQVRNSGLPTAILVNTMGIAGASRPNIEDGELKYAIGSKETPSSPVFTTPITTQTVTEGNPATFSAVVVGPTSYVWKKNGTTVAQTGPSVGPVQG